MERSRNYCKGNTPSYDYQEDYSNHSGDEEDFFQSTRRQTTNRRAGRGSEGYVSPEFTTTVQSKISKFEDKYQHFYFVFRSWKIKRQKSILALENLVEKVHKDQLSFNQANVAIKEINVNSRQLKQAAPQSNIDFWASLATFVTDAASGITSLAQACNVDSYNSTFKEIMENDEEFTKPLRFARSQCLQQYMGVEDVIRRHHAETFGGVMESLSHALRVEDLWSELKVKYIKSDSTGIMSTIDNFLMSNSRSDIWKGVTNSIQEYVDNNPAALDACKSAGKAFCDAYEVWGKDRKANRSTLSNSLSVVTNNVLMQDEKQELRHLRSIVRDESRPQAKLELKLRDAISSLKSELNEMEKACRNYR